MKIKLCVILIMFLVISTPAKAITINSKYDYVQYQAQLMRAGYPEIVEHEEEVDYPDIDEKDVYWLACIGDAENGCFMDDRMKLTMIVVLKRVKSKDYPDTVYGVISQHGQYATWIDGVVQNIVPSEKAVKLARYLMENEVEKDYPDNLVYQAEFTQGREIYAHIGYEYFCLK